MLDKPSDLVVSALVRLEMNEDFKVLMEYLQEQYADQSRLVTATEQNSIGRYQGRSLTLAALLNLAKEARGIMNKRNRV